MALLDQKKEEIAYLKLWQGVLLVTDISLIGWAVSTKGSSALLIGAACVAAAALMIFILVLHRRIDRLIDETGRL